MKSFSQHLEEAPAWTKSASEHIFTLDVHLPLSASIYKRIFKAAPPRMRVFHVTNPQYLDDMIALQGKRKSISAFTRMERDIIAGGINVAGGLVFQLDADILVSSPFDIMSRPDKTGRRWLELYYLTSFDPELGHVMLQDGKNAINALVTKYLGNRVPLASTFKIWADLDPRHEKSPLSPAKRSGKKGGGVSMFSTRRDTIKETNKILRDMIKDYIDAMEGVMKKHADRLGKALWKHAATIHYDRPADSSYDEYVVNRIKIEQILIDRETVKHAFGGLWSNMEREEIDGHFAQLLVKLGDKGIPYTVFDNASQVVRAVAAAADKGSQLQ